MVPDASLPPYKVACALCHGPPPMYPAPAAGPADAHAPARRMTMASRRSLLLRIRMRLRLHHIHMVAGARW
jgi:hypothetical protein